MIKRHFDMRLVFHGPNKCTELQYVFSSEEQPGPIIGGMSEVGRGTRKRRRERVGDEMLCLMSRVAVVY